MADLCKVCGGEMRRDGDYLVCKKCGIVEEIDEGLELPGDREYSQIKGFKRGYSSGYNTHKKEIGYKRNEAVFDALDKVKQYERVLFDTLPDDIARDLFERFTNSCKKNYEKGISATRDKDSVIFAIFVSMINSNLDELDTSDSGQYELAKIYSKILTTLEQLNPELWKNAERIGSEALHEKAVAFRKLDEKTFGFEVDLDAVDSKVENSYKKDFYKLFSKNTYDYPMDEVIKLEHEIRSKGTKKAFRYIENQGISQVEAGIKNPTFNKRDGLLCACCYLFCKDNGLKPASQSEWAKFFEISDSSMDKLCKEIKEMKDSPIFNNKPLTGKIEGGEIFLD